MEKKKMKLWKKILIVVLIVFVIFVAYTIRNYIILTKLINKAKMYADSKNYYAEVIGIQGESVNIGECYRKDDQYISIIRNCNKNIQDERKMIIYSNNDEKMAVIYSGEGKILLTQNIVLGEIQPSNISQHVFDNIFKLQISMIARIRADECNGNKCYLIEFAKGWKMWVDKETGLVIREINGSQVADRKYEFDVVEDEDIVKPDISDCTVVQ